MLLTSKPVVIVGRRDGKKEERYAGEERIRQAAETHATSLDLSGLGLREVPEPLGQLTALQWLDLSGNQLTALPASLGQLTALWCLTSTTTSSAPCPSPSDS
jgi:leucine-rich repeat protein SHOC2